MPKVSVIIPVYNVEKYLRECLDSVANQTVKDIEIICVNDCSTDTSLKILEEYASRDSRIKILSNVQNIHAGLSRNKGISCANGQYIYFMDADDFLELNAFEKVIEILDQNYDIDFCMFNKILVDQTTQERTPKNYFISNYANQKIFDRSLRVNLLYAEVPAWLKIYRKSFLENNNILFDDLKCANDRFFFINTVLKYQKAYLLDEYLIYHRINVENSLVTQRYKNFDCMYKSFRKVKKLAAKEPIEIKQAILEITIADLFLFYKKAPADAQKTLKKSLIKFLKSLEIDIDRYKTASWYDKYQLLLWDNNSIWQKIFSIKNHINGKHKMVTLLGIKLKIRKRTK